MKVSIITVVFNRVGTIGSAIDSVLGQSYADLEYIVIDGGSTDGTLDKISAYGDQIDVVISKSDRGIFDAMNKGLALANGEVIAFLNSDDFYAGTAVIEDVVKTLEDCDTDAVFGDLHYVYADDIRKVFRYWKSGVYKHGSFLYGWMPPHPTFFVRKRIYDQYGKFNTRFKIAADYELMLRFLHIHKIKVEYIPQVLVKMRTGGVSNAGLRNRFRANLEDRKAWTVNGVRPYFFTLYLKPLRKVFQVIIAQSFMYRKLDDKKKLT